jgi:hypothetical protein
MRSTGSQGDFHAIDQLAIFLSMSRTDFTQLCRVLRIHPRDGRYFIRLL